MTCIEIADRKIGPGHPPYMICELSGNHSGDLSRALDMIDAAADTGADAIKIQTYTPDTLTINATGPDFTIQEGLWTGRTLYDLYREAHTPYEWHPALFERARRRGVTLFSTAFDETAVELLSGLGAPAYKIASFEAVDLPLVARTAQEKKPLIISTGMANLGEIERVVEAALANGAAGLALLHCTSAYPAPTNEANLRTIEHMARAFDVPTGLSDHTLGTSVAVAAVAMGACIVEKHFTLSRAAGGADAAFSLEPDEFMRLVQDCRSAFFAMGAVNYARTEAERGSVKFRRSLYVVASLAAGDVFTPANVRSIRPGYGLAPRHMPAVIGRRAARALTRGQPLSWADIV